MRRAWRWARFLWRRGRYRHHLRKQCWMDDCVDCVKHRNVLDQLHNQLHFPRAIALR